MAIFVEHQETHDVFLLLGGGLGVYRSEDKNKFTNSVVQGEHKMVMVSSQFGSIYFINAEDLKVISVDGKPIGEFW